MSAAILSVLSVALSVQAPTTMSAVPQRPGLTVVSAVAGDTFLGNRRGDYEIALTVTSLSPAGSELTASSFVRGRAGRNGWLRVRRAVPATDLRSARTQVLGFDTEDVATVPGTTALGPSRLVMAEARQRGQVEFKVRNYASRRDNPGTLRRIGVDNLPVLLNGRRIALPAVHMRGQLGAPGHLRPWSFWFFDDPVQPITLKVSYGPEGAPETAPPEWLRQVIRIDVPDADGGMGNGGVGLAGSSGSPRGVDVAGADGSPSSGDGNPPEGSGRATPMSGEAGEAGVENVRKGAAEGSGSMGSGTVFGKGGGRSADMDSGGGLRGGSGLGAGGLGAMAGMTRDLAEACRVTVPGVYFEFDSDELNPASAPWIGMVAQVLRRRADWTVTIEGHTDSIGDPGYNLELSRRRAAALQRALVTGHGLDASKLGTQGFGAARPLEPNTTLEGRARNRRVELVRPCDRDRGKRRSDD